MTLFGLSEFGTNVLRFTLFHIFIIGMLAVDLGVFNRKAHTTSVKEALIWSGVWIGLSMLFAFGVYRMEGSDHALKWLTAYTVEKSLSVDNIFVFILLFRYFGIPSADQHRVLYWGILGAVIMRATLISCSVALVHLFSGVMLLFGLFLIYSGIKICFSDDEAVDPEQNFFLKQAKKYLRVSTKLDGHKFFTKIDGQSWATPLFMALIVIESTDLLFAFDSIPAVIAISTDPFIVYTSNIMAILGLRALYFAIAGIMDKFCYLKYGLSIVLSFIGLKMCAETIGKFMSKNWEMPINWSLTIVLGTIFLSVMASIIWPPKTKPSADEAVSGSVPATGSEAEASPAAEPKAASEEA